MRGLRLSIAHAQCGAPAASDDMFFGDDSS
jgi:hypothetical protein